MDIIAVPVDYTSKDQEVTLRLEPDNHAVVLRVKLEWHEYVGKWFASIWNSVTKECLLANFPIVGSKEYINDLLGQFEYMNIGSFSCASIMNELRGEDPRFDNMNLFELLWGDHIVDER